MVGLPKFGVLKSKCNDSYLRYINEIGSPIRSFLKYSGQEILSPFTKFEFEQAKSDPSLFHIKCCYNNKYWVSWACDHGFIIAGAEDKEEDRSKWTCTLFRPIYDSSQQSYRFQHVHLGLNVVLWRAGSHFRDCLRAHLSTPDRHLCDLSIVIDWESMWLLPKFIVFKSENGFYLSGRRRHNLPYLQFLSQSLEDPSIMMETVFTNDGKFRIKSIFFQRFWKRGTLDWIFADLDDSNSQDPDALFSPIKLSPLVVALRNLGADKFIKRYTNFGIESGLNAAVSEIDKFSHLRIIEPVFSREINNVVFYLSEAKIYNEVVIMLATREARNNFNVPNTARITFSYIDNRTSSWASSISTKLDVKTRIKSRVPLVSDGRKFDISSAKFDEEYKWGEIITVSKPKEVIYETIIPPNSASVITLIVTKGSYEIPFSYKQADVLIGGKEVEYHLEDGIYRGTNFYDLKYDVRTRNICGGPNE
ncbi:uncharacterized protein LOC111461140 [Cucurbita moschata]|uniref:Uncharacterized protein LOC111461140 n=1 Tax=Cucurbita moschata TaxID=3662 RepID=A0A6J1H8Z5_CUCMO|nr:uncharacterized protein LOC111461140 [Cucurbita moschata]